MASSAAQSSTSALLEAGVPEDIATAVGNFETAVSGIEVLVGRLLAAPWKELCANLPPLEVARVHLMVAYTVNTLFYMYLKTQGVAAASHPVRDELERVKAYIRKVKEVSQANDQRTEDEQRQVTLNAAAAQRFITHALSDRPLERDAPPDAALTGARDGGGGAAGSSGGVEPLPEARRGARDERAKTVEAELRARVSRGSNAGNECEAAAKLSAQLLAHGRELGLHDESASAAPAPASGSAASGAAQAKRRPADGVAGDGEKKQRQKKKAKKQK